VVQMDQSRTMADCQEPGCLRDADVAYWAGAEAQLGYPLPYLVGHDWCLTHGIDLMLTHAIDADVEARAMWTRLRELAAEDRFADCQAVLREHWIGP
jgi:hypothetical protein